MGRQVTGSVAANFAFGAVLLWSRGGLAQSAPSPAIVDPASSLPPPAAEPAPLPPTREPPAPSPPPPLSPPPPREPARRPSFLRTREELEAVKPSRVAPHSRAKMPNPDFVNRASPWVDFSLTSFYMKDRVGNFLNVGAQVGGYFFQHLRVSARIASPLSEVRDEQRSESSFFGGPTGNSVRTAPSRNMSVLYGASVGLVISNERSFVFAPNLGFLRTDVGDYGTAVIVGLPFEWTTSRNLRVGFEFALGHATGGATRTSCFTSSAGVVTSCGAGSSEREGGTSVLLGYYMGWALGRL